MQECNIQLFASDMDGTLLQKDFTISDVNVEAIKKLQEYGIHFVIATGRIYYDAVKICERYNLNPFIISNNGTCVFTPDGELLYSRPIPRYMIEALTGYLDQEGICYGIGTSKHYVTCNNWEDLLDTEIERLRERGIHIPKEKIAFAKQELINQNGVKYVNCMEEFYIETESIYSISLVTFDQKRLKNIEKKLNSFPSLMVSISGSHNAEIMEKRGTKDIALEHLCNILKITLDKVAAIGDSLNDLYMIQKAGIGIAVGNARDEIKTVCDFQVKSHTSDGVADAIHTILEQWT